MSKESISITKDTKDGSKTITVRKIENGFISKTEYWDDQKSEYICKEVYSQTDPLETDVVDSQVKALKSLFDYD